MSYVEQCSPPCSPGSTYTTLLGCVHVEPDNTTNEVSFEHNSVDSNLPSSSVYVEMENGICNSAPAVVSYVVGHADVRGFEGTPSERIGQNRNDTGSNHASNLAKNRSHCMRSRSQSVKEYSRRTIERLRQKSNCAVYAFLILASCVVTFILVCLLGRMTDFFDFLKPEDDNKDMCYSYKNNVTHVLTAVKSTTGEITQVRIAPGQERKNCQMILNLPEMKPGDTGEIRQRNSMHLVRDSSTFSYDKRSRYITEWTFYDPTAFIGSGLVLDHNTGTITFQVDGKYLFYVTAQFLNPSGLPSGVLYKEDSYRGEFVDFSFDLEMSDPPVQLLSHTESKFCSETPVIGQICHTGQLAGALYIRKGQSVRVKVSRPDLLASERHAVTFDVVLLF